MRSLLRCRHFCCQAVALLVLTLALVRPARGQASRAIDSLTRCLTLAAPDTNRVKTLNELGWEYLQPDPPAARRTLEQARQLAHRLGFAPGEVQALNTLGVSYINAGDFAQARTCLDAALALAHRGGAPVQLGKVLLNLSHLCNVQDDYACALQTSEEALRLFEARHDTARLSQVHTALGNLYSNRGDYPSALAQLLDALRLARRQHQLQPEANALGNLGNVYTRQGDHARALAYYQQCLPLLRRLPDSAAVAGAYISLGTANAALGRLAVAEAQCRRAVASYAQLGQSADLGQALGALADVLAQQHRRADAVATYQRALRLLQAAGDLDNTANALVRLAGILLETRQPVRAEAYARQALALARRVGDLRDGYEANVLLARLLKQRGDYRQALAHTERATALHDSLFSQAKAEEMGRLQGAYQLSQERYRGSELARRSQGQALRLRQQRWGLVGLSLGLAAALIGGLALWRLNALLGRRTRELTRLNAVKDRLFSIIGHDLRGPLNSLYAFVTLLTGTPIAPVKMSRYAQRLRHTLDHTVGLIDNLLGWAAGQLQAADRLHPAAVPLRAVVENAFDLLQESAGQKGLVLAQSLTGEEVVWADPDMLRLVVRNLLSNAVKFTPAGGQIRVSATRGAESWELAVADSGVGLTPEELARLRTGGPLPGRRAGTAQEPGTGLGLLLCRDFVQRNGGQLVLESSGSGQGTTVRIGLPPAPVPALAPGAAVTAPAAG